MSKRKGTGLVTLGLLPLALECATPKPAPCPSPGVESPASQPARDNPSQKDQRRNCYRGRGSSVDDGDTVLSARVPDAGTSAASGWPPSRKAVRDAVKRRDHLFQSCVACLPATAAGYITTGLAIANGKVMTSSIVASDGVSPTVEGCVGRAFCDLDLPQNDGVGLARLRETLVLGGGVISPSCYVGHDRPFHRPAPSGLSPDAGTARDAGPRPAGPKGSLDKDDIRKTIRGHISPIRLCYERALPANTDLRGRVNVEFVIDTDGAVAYSSVTSTTLRDIAVEDCIGKATCAWDFPKPNGGGFVIVSYPFYLTTDPPVR